jgi:hypothetical protein
MNDFNDLKTNNIFFSQIFNINLKIILVIKKLNIFKNVILKIIEYYKINNQINSPKVAWVVLISVNTPNIFSNLIGSFDTNATICLLGHKHAKVSQLVILAKKIKVGKK